MRVRPAGRLLCFPASGKCWSRKLTPAHPAPRGPRNSYGWAWAGFFQNDQHESRHYRDGAEIAGCEKRTGEKTYTFDRIGIHIRRDNTEGERGTSDHAGHDKGDDYHDDPAK